MTARGLARPFIQIKFTHFFRTASLAATLAASLAGVLASGPGAIDSAEAATSSFSAASAKIRARRRPAADEAALPSAESKAAKPREAGQRAVVKTDGAMVFAAPNMEGEPIRYLPKGKAIVVSQKAYGDPQLPFFKVKVDGGRFGYIATIDVAPASGDSDRSEPAPKGKKSSRAKAREEKDNAEEESGRKTFYESRYVGAAVALIDFVDGIGGADYRENTVFYGLRLNGQGMPFAPPSEINFLFRYGAPSFYERFSVGKPTGYAIYLDSLLMFPFAGGDNSMFYFLTGPAALYTSWGLTTVSSARQLSQLSLGLNLGVAGAFRIRKAAVRLDYKYVIMDRTQKGFVLSAQMEF